MSGMPLNLDPDAAELLNRFIDQDNLLNYDYSLRVNGTDLSTSSSKSVRILPQKSGPGLKVTVYPSSGRSVLYLPVIITHGGINETVHYDYDIKPHALVTIYSGCAIRNNTTRDAIHNSIHHFKVGAYAEVDYIEDHYGESFTHSPCIINPRTSIKLGSGSHFTIKTTQFAGLKRSNRKLHCVLSDYSCLKVDEKLLTAEDQTVEANYKLDLLGQDSRAELSSRSVATDDSCQLFRSTLKGTKSCFAHSSCDAIIKDNARVSSIPAISAYNSSAQLVHESAIGKIATTQILKLMTLGLTESAAEQKIIAGFLH